MFLTWRPSPLYLKLNVFSGEDPWRDETDFLHFVSLTVSGARGGPGRSKHGVLANSNSKTVSTP